MEQAHEVHEITCPKFISTYKGSNHACENDTKIKGNRKSIEIKIVIFLVDQVQVWVLSL